MHRTGCASARSSNLYRDEMMAFAWTLGLFSFDQFSAGFIFYPYYLLDTTSLLSLFYAFWFGHMAAARDQNSID